MKTKVLGLLLLLFSIQSLIAQIPNPGFESWTNNGDFDDLVDWTTGNPLSFNVTGMVAVNKTNDARTDSFAAKLDVQLHPSLGRVVGNVYGTFPITTRYASLDGFYKLAAPSAAPIEISISIRNSSSTEIGAGLITISAQTPTYTAFTVPISYTAGDAAAEMYIHVCACTGLGTNAVVGTDLRIDDFSVQGSVTGVNEANAQSAFTVFPNPSTQFVNLKFPEPLEEGDHLQLTDLQGRVLLEKVETGVPEMQLDTKALRPGLYLLNLHSNHARKYAQLIQVLP